MTHYPPSHPLFSPAVQIKRDEGNIYEEIRRPVTRDSRDNSDTMDSRDGRDIRDTRNTRDTEEPHGWVAATDEADEAAWETDSATSENSFFLSISRGRRQHLQLHRFADWDLGSETPAELSAKDESALRRRTVSFEETHQPKKIKLEVTEKVSKKKEGEAGLLEQVWSCTHHESKVIKHFTKYCRSTG